MNRYVLEDRIGQGTFGIVYRATKKGEPECGKFYAVKKLKQMFLSWQDVVVEREFKAIEALMGNRGKKRTISDRSKENKDCFDHYHRDNDRDHLVCIFEVLRERDACLYFVMEYMKDGNLQNYIAAKSKFKSESAMHIGQLPQDGHTFHEPETRSILCQIFRGLRHIHSLGYVHRDIKPENILLHGSTAKLADFSLARPFGETRKRTNYGNNTTNCQEGASRMTNYIGTRWYRAPELLRKCSTTANINRSGNLTINDHDHDFYTEAIDVFAMGCVAAELYRCRPLFEGKDETDQLQLIENLLLVNPSSSRSTASLFGGDSFECDGFFDNGSKEEGNGADVKNRLAREIQTMDYQTVHFIHSLLYIRPERRMKTREILRQAYFERENTVNIGKGNGDDASSRTHSIPNAVRARRFSIPKTPESTVAFPSTNDHESETARSPTVLGNTMNASKFPNKSLSISSTVRITPTPAAAKVGSITDAIIDTNAGHNMLWDNNGTKDRIIENIKQPSPPIKMSSLKRNRPKLRPSQIFKID